MVEIPDKNKLKWSREHKSYVAENRIKKKFASSHVKNKTPDISHKNV